MTMERDTPSWLSGRTVLRGAFVLGVLAIVVPFIITGAPSVVGAEESYEARCRECHEVRS